MQRVTISIDDELAGEFDAVSHDRRYRSRSEAVRDLVRAAVEARRLAADATGACVASLSYVYNHAVRDLAQRLSDAGHRHHGLVVSTTHVHLDHEDCLETTILKGSVADVRAFANAVRAERGSASPSSTWCGSSPTTATTQPPATRMPATNTSPPPGLRVRRRRILMP